MEAEIAAKLLLSIEADRLVIVCGAGLSMPEPSKVPSAAELAVYCSEEYLKITGESVPPQAEGRFGDGSHILSWGRFGDGSHILSE